MPSFYDKLEQVCDPQAQQGTTRKLNLCLSHLELLLIFFNLSLVQFVQV